MSAGPTTRDRILDAALRLFAERGYHGTTVGDIEQAAGLTPRAGGLYRHFRSKRHVLEAALERPVAENQAILSAMELMPLGDLRAELVLLGRWTLQHLERQSAFLRVLLRDGDQFPDLVAAYHRRAVLPSHREAAAWLRRKLRQEGLPPHDCDAVAAAAIAALVGYHMDRLVFGRPPGDVDQERFLNAWADAWVAAVRAPIRKEDSREPSGP
ncbi:MAG TPA: helix-turn-helix domain-containing protein [Dehalococcoidia bacterium]